MLSYLPQRSAKFPTFLNLSNIRCGRVAEEWRTLRNNAKKRLGSFALFRMELIAKHWKRMPRKERVFLQCLAIEFLQCFAIRIPAQPPADKAAD